jgi:hypothetical protein
MFLYAPSEGGIGLPFRDMKFDFRTVSRTGCRRL